MPSFDEDAFFAAIDLVGRTGATDFFIGYDSKDESRWMAAANYGGTRIEEVMLGPVEAAEALARRLLESGECQYCHGMITLSDHPPWESSSRVMVNGKRLTAAEVMALPRCRWSRQGRAWMPGCRP